MRAVLVEKVEGEGVNVWGRVSFGGERMGRCVDLGGTLTSSSGRRSLEVRLKAVRVWMKS